jgi:hypothetical protein
MEVGVKSYAMVLVLFVSAAALGQEMELPAPPPATHAAAQEREAQIHPPYTHPQLAGDARWAGATTLIILGSFLAAAAVGVVVYTEKSAETHAAHDDAHDEHGHGHDSHH